MAGRSSLQRLIESRMRFILLGILLGVGAIVGRYFYVQVFNHAAWTAEAQAEHGFDKVLEPQRGEMFIQDRFGETYPVAINKTVYSIYVTPFQVQDKESAAQALSSILQLKLENVTATLATDSKGYLLLAKDVDTNTATALQNKNIAGVYEESSQVREYPLGDALSQTIGFVGYNSQNQRTGMYGLEKSYNEVLEGRQGQFAGEESNSGIWLPFANQDIQPSQNGSNLNLTIDYAIQTKTQQELDAAVKKWNAESGAAVVMNPMDGSILALAGTPDFDPNNFQAEKDFSVFLNPITQVGFEPGSVFKPFTMAMGLDLGLVTPETTYDDTGAVKLNGYVVHNFDNKGHGVKTMTQVLEMSLNTGATFVEQKVGMDEFNKYVSAFQLNGYSGIDLPETVGSFANLNNRLDINYATASFGQGVRMTPIEIVRALAAIANGGYLVKPHVVASIQHPDGSIDNFKPPAPIQIMKPETAHTLAAMLVDVVEHGYDAARIPGYSVAGKTGTAQIPNPNGGGYLPADETIHSFIGFAPAYDPKFLIFMKIVKPKGVSFASNSLTSYFRDLTNFILQYMQIPPDRPLPTALISGSSPLVPASPTATPALLPDELILSTPSPAKSNITH